MKKLDDIFMPSFNTSGRSRKVQGCISFLSVIAKFAGCPDTREVKERIMAEIIAVGLYEPKGAASVYAPLAEHFYETGRYPDLAVQQIMIQGKTTQQWYNRVNTLTISLRSLGLYCIDGGRITITELGKLLLASIDPNTSEIRDYDTCGYVLRNILVNRPHIVVRNKEKCAVKTHYVFLLGVLRALGSISMYELIIISGWPNSDVVSCCKAIRDSRQGGTLESVKDYVIYTCYKIGVDSSQYNCEKEPVQNLLSAFTHNILDFYKYTNLIVIRDSRLFLNTDEQTLITYILSNYTQSYLTYNAPMVGAAGNCTLDPNLRKISISINRTPEEKVKAQSQLWTLEELWQQMSFFCGHTKVKYSEKLAESKVNKGAAFEFIFALLLSKLYPDIRVSPRYLSDVDGFVESHAPGGGVDLIVEADKVLYLVELTLTKGASQFSREFESITRHINEYRAADAIHTLGIFIVPALNKEVDSLLGYRKEKPVILPITIHNLIECYKSGLSASDWLHRSFIATKTDIPDNVYNR